MRNLEQVRRILVQISYTPDTPAPFFGRPMGWDAGNLDREPRNPLDAATLELRLRVSQHPNIGSLGNHRGPWDNAKIPQRLSADPSLQQGRVSIDCSATARRNNASSPGLERTCSWRVGTKLIVGSDAETVA